MGWRFYRTTIEQGASRKPALVLVDDRFSTDAPVAALHRLCWVGVWNSLPSTTGFWDPSETEALDRIEDDLAVLADQLGGGWAVYVLRTCTLGVREFYIHAGDGARLAELLPRLRQLHPRYRIEYDESRDPRWELYRKYLGAAE